MGSAPDAKPDSEIVGVVENISYRNVREPSEQAYFPIGTELSGSNFYVRFQGTPESAFRSIRAILRNADVLRDAILMIAAGTAIALPCVWALGRLVDSQLYDVKPSDPVTIVAATLVLCSTALGAALVPARRASAVNPTEALRFE